MPIRTSHKLTCGWCNASQDVVLVKKAFDKKTSRRIHYACDVCTRRLQIYKSVNGFFLAMMADKQRYLRNVKLNKNRI